MMRPAVKNRCRLSHISTGQCLSRFNFNMMLFHI
nr:MAG TPA: hypothetical protein [Caudoviricetes sp.]